MAYQEACGEKILPIHFVKWSDNIWPEVTWVDMIQAEVKCTVLYHPIVYVDPHMNVEIIGDVEAAKAVIEDKPGTPH